MPDSDEKQTGQGRDSCVHFAEMTSNFHRAPQILRPDLE
jgi:hypothetical protein